MLIFLVISKCYVLDYSCTCGGLMVHPGFQIKWSRFMSCSALGKNTLLSQFLHPSWCKINKLMPSGDAVLMSYNTEEVDLFLACHSGDQHKPQWVVHPIK